jgi:hypothetical protein
MWELALEFGEMMEAGTWDTGYDSNERALVLFEHNVELGLGLRASFYHILRLECNENR